MSGTPFQHPMIITALEIFDDDKLDKEWVVRNVLGGMAAGFGLRGDYLNVLHNEFSLISEITFKLLWIVIPSSLRWLSYSDGQWKLM
jgi:hypothetical protein